MTDLVERLRVFSGGINDYELWPKGLRHEAADEIERLRAVSDAAIKRIERFIAIEQQLWERRERNHD